jgi:hypothetical protein
MSIDPRRLRAALQLVTGTAPSIDDANGLALRLGIIEEVLPWMVLRREAFADMPALTDMLATAAKRSPSPATRRKPSRVSSLTHLAAERQIEAALSALISDNIARADVVMSAEMYISNYIRILEAPKNFDAQYRITITDR